MQSYSYLWYFHENNRKIVLNYIFFRKKREIVWKFRKNAVPLQLQLENCIFIGIWCNGNTTDSGPVILGSSPSIPTQKIAKSLNISAWRFLHVYNSRLFPDLYRTYHSNLNSMGIVIFALIGLLFCFAGIHFGMAFTTRRASSSSVGSTSRTNSISLKEPSGSTKKDITTRP